MAKFYELTQTSGESVIANLEMITLVKIIDDETVEVTLATGDSYAVTRFSLMVAFDHSQTPFMLFKSPEEAEEASEGIAEETKE